jgi:hypothetical protein
MTAPDSRGPSGGGPAPGSPDPNPFAEAEKLMAQWEARHAIAAADRRVVGQAVPQYLSHERCTEACSSPGHHDEPHQARDRRVTRRRPPPDVHPHVSDLLAWVLPATPSDDERPRRRSHRAD